jgi:biotin operon repressor
MPRSQQNANPVREVRLVRLANILMRGKPVSRKTLEDALEISRATLTRDIATLREQLNMPIAYDHEMEGYVLANEKEHVGPRYELPGIWLNDREASAMLTLTNVVVALDPGILGHTFSPLRSWVKRIARLDYRLLPEVSEKLSIQLFFGKRYDEEIFGSISTALYRDRQVDIELFGRDEVLVQASLQRYVLARDGWFIDVFVENPERVLRIPMENIREVRELRTPARRLSVAEEWSGDEDEDQSEYYVHAGSRDIEHVPPIEWPAEAGRGAKSRRW